MPINRYAQSIGFTATTTSAAYVLPVGYPRYEVVNRGQAAVFIAFGGATVTAAAPTTTPSGSFLIAAGSILAGDLLPAQTHVAAMAETGTARVVVHTGEKE
jgi:hypothetical protein